MRTVLVLFLAMFLVGCGADNTSVKTFEGEANTPENLTQGNTEQAAPSAPGRLD